jgi:hypothetical protein
VDINMLSQHFLEKVQKTPKHQTGGLSAQVWEANPGPPGVGFLTILRLLVL